MSIAQLILSLKSQQIRIRLVDGQLKVSSKSGKPLDDVLLQELKKNKAALIRFLKEDGGRTTLFRPIPPAPHQEVYDVSHAQKRLLLLTEFDEANIAYNSMAAKRITGSLNLEAFRQSFHTLVERHHSLRTIFLLVGGEFQQKVVDAAQINYKMEYVDLRNDPNQAIVIEEAAKAHSRHLFKLNIGPMLKTTLLHIQDGEYVFLCVIHHIISDGWSLNVFLNELMQVYDACCAGLKNPLYPLTLQYQDYSVWQNDYLSNSPEVDQQRLYWQRQFSEAIEPLALAADFKRPPVKTYVGRLYKDCIDPEQTRQLNLLAQRYNVSLFTTLLAAVKALLFRYTRQEDITIGTSVAGREHLDLENQIGFFVNSVALRTRFSSDDTFVRLLLRVQETVVEGLQYGTYPFDRILDDLELEWDLSRSPLFDVKVVLQTTGRIKTLKNVRAANQKQSIAYEDYPLLHEVSIYDLSFRFTELDSRITLDLEYNTDLFRDSRVHQISTHFKTLLTSILANENDMLGRLVYIPVEERQKMLINHHNDK